MKDDYTFRLAKDEDLDQIIKIIKQRQEWFKMKNIRQWSKYIENHPIEEWNNSIANNSLYVLSKKDKIFGCVEIKFYDSEFWDNSKNLYVHKLCTKVSEKNAGKIIIENLKEMAIKNNVNKIRLDCLNSNKKLNDIYDSYGFKFIKDGFYDKYQYHYNLRELRVL